MAAKAKKKWLKISIVFLCSILSVVLIGLLVLQIGVYYTGRNWKYYSPDYEKTDLTEVLSKSDLSEEDYNLLYRQTGLTKLGVDDLLAAGDEERIYEIQNFFFAEHKVKTKRCNPFTYLDKIEANAPMAILRDGDILVSATTRVSWWRYGHAALVVDAANGLILESSGPGYKSNLDLASTFANLADFIILRPHADEETKAQVVQFARERLMNIPYKFTTGIFTKKGGTGRPKATQCAHLVWYAYNRFGINLDSNGGKIVKPRDMANSDKVSVVQAFGFDLDKLWS